MIRPAIDTWLYNNFQNRLVCRTPFFRVLLEIIDRRKHEIIVETGTTRDNSLFAWAGDGCATIIFNEWLKTHKGFLWSVDSDPEAIAKSKALVGKDRVAHICDDSVNYFKSWIVKEIDDHTENLVNGPTSINVLYLDSLDGNMHDLNDNRATEHQIAEFDAAHEYISDNGIIALDDVLLKGRKSLPYMIQNGWKVLFQSPPQHYSLEGQNFTNFGTAILGRR